MSRTKKEITELKYEVEEKDFYKNKIEFKPRNERQLLCWNVIDENIITFIIGSVGSGKTRIATTKALSLLETKKYKQIILLRSATIMAKEQIGFLKGDLSEKIQPLLLPMKASFEKVITKNQYEQMILEGKIFPYCLAYLEGLSFEKSVIILDEFQNLDIETLKMVMTRIDDSCKLLICGDKNQIKLEDETDSCIWTIGRFYKKPYIQIFEFTEKDIVRGKITKVVNSCFEVEENKTYITEKY